MLATSVANPDINSSMQKSMQIFKHLYYSNLCFYRHEPIKNIADYHGQLLLDGLITILLGIQM